MTNILISRLTSVFGAPDRVDDMAAFAAELTKLTAGFDVDALDHAASGLIRDGGKYWPEPRAIVQACIDAREAIALRSSNAVSRSKPPTPWELDDERAETWAKDFCRVTELGQRAFGEGWGRSVYQWAKSYARACLRRGASPEMAKRPAPFEIDYWVRRCVSLSHMVALDRASCLGEPFPPDVGAPLKRRLAELARQVGHAMPVEDEEPPTDHVAVAWEDRFGR